MINTEPYLIGPMDEIDIDLHLIDTHLPQLNEVMDTKVTLLKTHTLLHVMGEESTPAHRECLDLIRIHDRYIRRGFKALWN